MFGHDCGSWATVTAALNGSRLQVRRAAHVDFVGLPRQRGIAEQKSQEEVSRRNFPATLSGKTPSIEKASERLADDWASRAGMAALLPMPLSRTAVCGESARALCSTISANVIGADRGVGPLRRLTADIAARSCSPASPSWPWSGAALIPRWDHSFTSSLMNVANWWAVHGGASCPEAQNWARGGSRVFTWGVPLPFSHAEILVRSRRSVLKNTGAAG